ncbi:MAG TPA: transcriptional repressor [Atribacterota bacterium]|nr:transcriptional repressor [Atribacterota bacterium]
MPRGWYGGGPGGWWQRQFRGGGYRITMPRQIILQVLDESKRHLSAEDIYLKVYQIYPTIGLTTVYRTLELLVRMGLVFKFDFGDGRARYELTRGDGNLSHHHHLICTNCGRIIDYDDFIEEELELIKKTRQELEKKYGFEIRNHTLQFYGLCKKCKAIKE